MEKKYRYTSIGDFKVGEIVWVTGVCFYKSGRIKYLLKPTKTEIIKLNSNSGGRSGVLMINPINYIIPSEYYIDQPEDYTNKHVSVNCNIAKTKEEAIENFNFRLKEEIEIKYEAFRRFEKSVNSRLL